MSQQFASYYVESLHQGPPCEHKMSVLDVVGGTIVRQRRFVRAAEDEPLMEWTVHPDTETLEGYALGRLSDPESGQVEEHLMVCPDCCNALSEFDCFLALLHEATESSDDENNAASQSSE